MSEKSINDNFLEKYGYYQEEFEELYLRIHQAARNQNISIQQLAMKAGLAKNYIYSWKKKPPTRRVIFSVINTLGISAEDILPRSSTNRHEDSTDILQEFSKPIRDRKYNAGGKEIDRHDWDIINAVLARYKNEEL